MGDPVTSCVLILCILLFHPRSISVSSQKDMREVKLVASSGSQMKRSRRQTNGWNSSRLSTFSVGDIRHVYTLWHCRARRWYFFKTLRHVGKIYFLITVLSELHRHSIRTWGKRGKTDIHADLRPVIGNQIRMRNVKWPSYWLITKREDLWGVPWLG